MDRTFLSTTSFRPQRAATCSKTWTDIECYLSRSSAALKKRKDERRCAKTESQALPDHSWHQCTQHAATTSKLIQRPGQRRSWDRYLPTGCEALLNPKLTYACSGRAMLPNLSLELTRCGSRCLAAPGASGIVPSAAKRRLPWRAALFAG